VAASKTQVLNKLKASARYKKAPPARKKLLRQKAVDGWNRLQPKNYTAEALGGTYQYPRALLEGTPELLALFKRAFVKGWPDEKLKAEIENTGWYRNNSTRWREVEETRLKNPGEFNKSVSEARYRVATMASQLGATLDEGELDRLSRDAVYGGWEEGDMRRYVSAEIDVSSTGGLFGETGQAEIKLRQMANENGVEYNDQWFRSQAVNAVKFNSVGDVELQMREDSANKYSQWGDGIRKGTTTVAKAAGSYLRSVERTYDMEDGSASVFDPHVKKALTNRDEQGNPVTKPLWAFEEDLRRDPKWLTTKNGSETMSNVAGGLLQEWGFLNDG